MLGGALPRLGLLLEGHGAGMAVARPWREDQQEAGIGLRGYRAALAGIELEEVAGARRDGLAVGRGNVDLSVDDYDPRALVHLMLLQFLPGREAQQDRPRILAGREDRRLMRLRLDAPQIPALHAFFVSGRPLGGFRPWDRRRSP